MIHEHFYKLFFFFFFSSFDRDAFSNSRLEKIHWTKQSSGEDERRVAYDSRSDESQDRVVLEADMSLAIRGATLSGDDGIYRCKTKREWGEE